MSTPARGAILRHRQRARGARSAHCCCSPPAPESPPSAVAIRAAPSRFTCCRPDHRRRARLRPLVVRRRRRRRDHVPRRRRRDGCRRHCGSEPAGRCSSSPRRSSPCCALVLWDLAIPGDSHLTNIVLSAGGLDQLGDVFDRRIALAGEKLPQVPAFAVLHRGVGGDRRRSYRVPPPDHRLVRWPARRAGRDRRRDRRDDRRHPGQRLGRAAADDRNRVRGRVLRPGLGRPAGTTGAPLALRRPAGATANLILTTCESPSSTPYSWTYEGGVNRHAQALAEQLIEAGTRSGFSLPGTRRTASAERSTAEQLRESGRCLTI